MQLMKADNANFATEASATTKQNRCFTNVSFFIEVLGVYTRHGRLIDFLTKKSIKKF